MNVESLDIPIILLCIKESSELSFFILQLICCSNSRDFLNRRTDIQGWKLLSTNIVRKYIGPLDLCLSYILCTSGYFPPSQVSERAPQLDQKLFTSFQLGKTYTAMKIHYSQFVWFRRLFVIFSRYSYLNVLCPIHS